MSHVTTNEWRLSHERAMRQRMSNEWVTNESRMSDVTHNKFATRAFSQSAQPRTLRETWLIHMCDMTHSYEWLDSFICVTWLIHMSDLTHSYVWHDSFIWVTWLIHECDMTHPCLTSHNNSPFVFSTAKNSWKQKHMGYTTHLYLWHYSFIWVTCLIDMCETWLIHMSDMTRSWLPLRISAAKNPVRDMTLHIQKKINNIACEWHDCM